MSQQQSYHQPILLMGEGGKLIVFVKSCPSILLLSNHKFYSAGAKAAQRIQCIIAEIQSNQLIN